MTSTDIDTLEAGRELDALVAEKVMGLGPSDYHLGPYVVDLDGEGACSSCKQKLNSIEPIRCYDSYSTSISTAWEVWEHMKTKPTPQGGIYWYTFVEMLEEGIDWDYPNNCINITDLLQSLNPLAICRAALKAVEVT